jgi:hypothetical protein
MSADLDNGRICYPGSGESVSQLLQAGHECKNVCSSSYVNTLTNPLLVYRVSWLRAKARFSRWSEELCLVESEMQWTVNWFQWKVKQWRTRLRDLEEDERPPGLDSYCHKQMVLWDSLAEQAQTRFSTLLGRPLFC